MNLNIKKYTIYLVILLTILLVLNILILNVYPNLQISDSILIKIFTFSFLLNITHFIILKLLLNKWGTHAGFLFMALSLTKMFASALFILFVIIKQIENPTAPVLDFMIIYMLTLTLEVFFVVKNMTEIS